MRIILATNWWSLVIRGVIAILLGVITFAWPGITLTALGFLFGAYALLDGIISLIGAVRAARAHERWGALSIEGFAGVAAATAAIVWPPITVLALVYIICAWAVVTGNFEMAAPAWLRKYIAGEVLLALVGLASLAFGILIMISPIAGAVVIALWVGAYAVVFGPLLVALGFRLRTWAREVSAGGSVSMPLHHGLPS
jgi:uncharacterized membrane protein HdeD (DUF308 family)